MDKSSQPLTKAMLKQFQPLQHLQELHLTLLLDCGEHHSVEHDAVLFKAGALDPLDYFLLEGNVRLQAEDGRTHLIEAGTAKAHYPLSHLRPHHYTATAIDHVSYFSVDAAVLKELIETCSVSFGPVEDIDDLSLRSINPYNADAEHLLVSMQADLSSGKLVLPALSDVAVRLREKLQDPAIDLEIAAKLIASEPAIAARLVQAANSPLYRRGTPCISIHNALMRLGMNTTRHLILGLLLRDLFTTKDIVLKKQCQRNWHESVMVAAACCVLTRHVDLFTAGEAMLAGLVHLIGDIAVMPYVSHYPSLLNNEKHLQTTLEALRGIAGKALLQSWKFPEPLITVAAQSQNKERQHDGPADLCDLVILARHLALSNQLSQSDEHALFPLPLAANYFPQLSISVEFQQQLSKETSELLAEIGDFLF